jgi:hypothetical protein
MNKEEYYRKSKNNNLPNRCPILNICARRAQTIYFFSYSPSSKGIYKTLMEEGEIPPDFGKSVIEIQGESPTVMKGATFASFNHCCPEVNLFDSNHRWGGSEEIASVSGEWDKLWEGKKNRHYETKHYSECSEYSFHLHKSNKNIIVKRKARIPIPQKTKALLQKEIDSKCPFCNSEDVDHFEIHHIDEDPSNNTIGNLIMVCPTCHSKITKADIIVVEVLKKKIELVNKVTKLNTNKTLLLVNENKITNNGNQVSEHDIKTIKYLLNILDVDIFQKEIFEQDGWYGYTKDSIHKILNFQEEAGLLKNKIINNDLNGLVKKFLKSLHDFVEISCKAVFGKDGDWYISIHFDKPDQTERRKISNELNKKSKIAFKELEKIITFLKIHEIDIYNFDDNIK